MGVEDMEFIKKVIAKIKNGEWREIKKELAWISQYGLRYKGSIAWYLFLGILGIVVGLFGSVLSKYIIDAVTGYQFRNIGILSIAYIVMQLLVIGLGAWSNRVSAKIEIKVEQEIRAEIYDNVLNSQWESVQQYHSGDLLNRLNGDVRSVSASVLGWIPSLVTGCIQFFGTLAVILYYDPTLAGFALISAPITFGVSYFFMRKMRRHNKKMRKISSDVLSFDGESLRNLQLIKSFGVTDLYGKKFRQMQETYKEERLSYNQFSIFNSSFMSLVGTVVGLLCFGWGIYRLWSGFITFGTMTLFLQLAAVLSGSFHKLVRLVPAAITAATAAGRIMEVAELPKEQYLHTDLLNKVLEKKEGISVTIRQACFAYQGEFPVLNDVCMEAKSGEVIGLIGASGTGKTTLFRILLGLLSVQVGEVCVSNIPVSAATRRIFSYVPQNNVLFSGTIAENMRMVKSDASDVEIEEALKLACAFDFVQELPNGIYSDVKEQGGGFSEGQLQRLSIARALLADAPILLLDEATSALDRETELAVLQNIIKVNSAKICIIATHRTEVFQMCNRVFHIENNTLKEVEKSDLAGIDFPN